MLFNQPNLFIQSMLFNQPNLFILLMLFIQPMLFNQPNLFIQSMLFIQPMLFNQPNLFIQLVLFIQSMLFIRPKLKIRRRLNGTFRGLTVWQSLAVKLAAALISLWLLPREKEIAPNPLMATTGRRQQCQLSRYLKFADAVCLPIWLWIGRLDGI